MIKKWYALYTMPRWEKKVADLLTKKSVVNYCPLNKVQRQWSDRKKIVEEPLFTSYVFVQVSDNDHLAVKQTSGVLNFVYWLGKPAVIHDYEIDTIKRFLNEYQDVQLEKTEVEMDERVRILNGAFMQYEGQVVEVNNKTVKVQLPSLGYALVAKVEKANIKLLDHNEGELYNLRLAK